MRVAVEERVKAVLEVPYLTRPHSCVQACVPSLYYAVRCAVRCSDSYALTKC